MAALPNPWRCCWVQAQFLDLLGTTRVKVFATTSPHVREEDGRVQHPAAQGAQHPMQGGWGGQGINPSRRCPRALAGCDAHPGWVWERGRSPRTPPRTRQGGDIRAGRWLWGQGLFPRAPAWLHVPGGRRGGAALAASLRSSPHFVYHRGLDPVRKRGRVGRAEGRIWPPTFASSGLLLLLLLLWGQQQLPDPRSLLPAGRGNEFPATAGGQILFAGKQPLC